MGLVVTCQFLYSFILEFLKGHKVIVRWMRQLPYMIDSSHPKWPEACFEGTNINRLINTTLKCLYNYINGLLWLWPWCGGGINWAMSNIQLKLITTHINLILHAYIRQKRLVNVHTRTSSWSFSGSTYTCCTFTFQTTSAQLTHCSFLHAACVDK